MKSQGTHDEEKQNENTTQHVLDITVRKQTQTRHEPSYKQLEEKTDITHTELRT